MRTDRVKNYESYETTGLHIIAVVSAKTNLKVICLKPALMQDETMFDKSRRASTEIRHFDLHHTINISNKFEPWERLQ